MSIVAAALFPFDNTFARELEGLYEPWSPSSAPEPRLLVLNDALARELGVDPDSLRAPPALAVLSASAVPEGATPIAQAYSGHQFGGFSPRLGDGRAVLLGEVRGRDLHLKGSGRTSFARGGDGKATVGPMLREYVMGEAMHALGIPTTRALAVVATGESVLRETVLPGAVLTRVATSHLRVGTFQYALVHRDRGLLRRLTDYAIERHHPGAGDALAFFEAVLDAQAHLVARWMLVGFIHGVMNTDNMTISGETIDYGPCAFMDAFDPATVFSSIDHGGRYAFGNQPHIAQWNLARLAEALLGLIDPDADAAIAAATEVLQSFPDRFQRYWLDGMRTKLGLTDARPEDEELVADLLALMEAEATDYTSFFRALPRGAVAPVFAGWVERWRQRVGDPVSVLAAMDAVNPVYIPRNHLVEDALVEATVGNLEPFHRLVDVVSDPFMERPGLDAYAEPAPNGFGDGYRTFCGT